MDYNNFALGEMSLSMFMYEVFTPKFLPLSAQVRGMIWQFFYNRHCFISET